MASGFDAPMRARTPPCIGRDPQSGLLRSAPSGSRPVKDNLVTEIVQTCHLSLPEPKRLRRFQPKCFGLSI